MLDVSGIKLCQGTTYASLISYEACNCILVGQKMPQGEGGTFQMGPKAMQAMNDSAVVGKTSLTIEFSKSADHHMFWI